MSPVCHWCGSWINRANRDHPGYDTPACRDQAHHERLAWLAHKARARRSRRLGALGPRTRTDS
jgi:hypothetical protein